MGSRVVWTIVLREHAAHDIFVDLDAKGVSELLGDAQVAELGIARFQLDNGRDEFRGGAFRAGLASCC